MNISKSLSAFFKNTTPIITILAVITPFVFIASLFFPYITAKALYFRILVEVMVLFYIFHALADRSVRPRWSPVMWVVTIFTAIIGITTLTAQDPLRSFWSNYERMEGYVLFIHLFAYFLVAGAVMKYKEGWWLWFFRASLVMSVIVGIHAFVTFYGVEGQTGYRIFGTLGNSSYLGIYSLAHFFVALFFIIRRIGGKVIKSIEGHWVSVSTYSLIALFNLIVLFNTGTRGSFVGLVIGIFVASLLIAIFERKHKALRITGITLIGVSVLFVLVLGAARNTSFVKNSDMLSRFSVLVTPNIKEVLNTQGKARSLLWGIAWDGVKERPLVGWGLDNFHYVFAKHYNPAMSSQEQWFDRSHNVFMDWLSQAGFVGLLSYLSLFGGSLYVIWKKRKEEDGEEGGMAISERAVITGALVAYLGHNLFVFDNLSSYVLFFSLLAFLHQYTIRKKVAQIENQKNRYAEFSSVTWSTVSLLAVVVFVYVLYITNIKPLIANTSMIDSMRQVKIDPVTKKEGQFTAKERFEALQKSIGYGTMTNAEQKEQLADRAAEVFGSNETAEYKTSVHQYTIQQLEESIRRTPEDPRPHFFYAMYLIRIGDGEGASRMAEQTLALSPNKLSFINFYGLIQSQLKRPEQFLALAKRSHELDPTNEEAYSLYITALGQNGQFDEAEKLAASKMTKYLTNWDNLLTYINANQSNRVIALLKNQIIADPLMLDLRSALASVYSKTGKTELAIKELEEIKVLAPQYAQTVDKLIEEVKNEAKIK